jgi:H+-transporting ATPase
MSQAFLAEGDGTRVVKGAFQAVAGAGDLPADARRRVDALGAQGHRVIAAAAGSEDRRVLAGLIALSDPPREDSAALVAALRQMNDGGRDCAQDRHSGQRLYTRPARQCVEH